MKRHSFIKLLGASIVIVSTGNALDLITEEKFILHGDGIADDTVALQAFLDGKAVFLTNGTEIIRTYPKLFRLPTGDYKISNTIFIRNMEDAIVDGNSSTIFYNYNKHWAIDIDCSNISLQNINFQSYCEVFPIIKLKAKNEQIQQKMQRHKDRHVIQPSYGIMSQLKFNTAKVFSSIPLVVLSLK